jgi:hypothetical protein
VKKIRGIQIIAKEAYTLTSYEKDVSYCKGFIEMTVDFTDGSNRVITSKELKEMIDKESEAKNG